MAGSGVPGLRPATPADADALADTVSEGFGAYRAFAPPGWEPPGRLELAIGIAGRLLQDDVVAAVAEAEDGTVAGHAILLPASRSRLGSDDPELGHVEQVFVRRSHWGTGVAARLLASVVAAAPRRGFTTLRLFTPLDHARALRFYAREGWERVGEPLTGEPIGLTLVELRRGCGPRAPNVPQPLLEP